MRSIGRWLLVGWAATVPGEKARRESVLVVSVGEVKTGAFIVDAQVRIASLGRIVRTQWNGEAKFVGVATGRYRIQVRAIGYAPGEVDVEVKADTASVHFELDKIKPVLDTVRVMSTRDARHLDEFETRRRHGIGRFITDSLIAAERAKGIQQMLVSHFPGLKVAGSGVLAMQPSPKLSRLDDRCPVLIYVDGFKYKEPDPSAIVDNLNPISLLEISGIEAYSRTTAPVQYRPLGDYCKVILFWTKR